MQQILPSLLDPPILFAHRGARAHAPDNTLESFALALKLGATGLESDVWFTADGEVVCDHDGMVRTRRMKRTPIGGLRRDQLPAHVPTLAELVDLCGDRCQLSLDLKCPGVGPATIAVVRGVASGLMGRLWLCSPLLSEIEPLRALDADVRLVDSPRFASLREGPERRAAHLASVGIDGINMPGVDWTGGLVALFHRFERTAFSWGLQHEHQLRPALRMGVDAVYSDFVDRMVNAYGSELGGAAPDTA
ncbi:MAG TPA: glycerophosphodiester phosphodiesterase [Ilumatobacter sp.]|nr:glycerophosphodiester phosphodiesterase [Ilumatobacter sp.]